MKYKTINLKPDTYSRLILYRHGRMTFDDVLNQIMDLVPEDEFYARVLKEHRERMKRIRAGEHAESDKLDEALNES